MQLFIPVQLVEFCVNKHLQLNVYRINRHVKTYGFFTVLKHISTTGVIKDYNKQIDLISKVTKYSKSNVYKYIADCESLGLLSVKNGNVICFSWQKVLQKIMPDVGYNGHKKQIKYSIENTKQKPKLIFYAAEIKLNKQLQTLKIQDNIDTYLSLFGIVSADTTPYTLHQLQLQTYIGNKTNNPEIYTVNADTERSVRTIRQRYNIKSNIGVKYLKNVLTEAGVIEVHKRVYTSAARNRVPKIYYSGYIKETKSTFWQLPDFIEVKC